MTYYESAQDVIITKARARYELKRHGVENEFEKFLSDMGDRAEYSANKVLEWLGY